MTDAISTIRTLLGRLVPAALIAAAVALGGSAIASAEPVWDIEEYDYCLRQVNSVPTTDPIAREDEAIRYCCYRSGGVDGKNGDCVAPAATDPQQSSGGSRPLPTTLKPIPGDLLGPDVAPPAAAP